MGALSPTHWLIVIGVFLLLFGAKKLPDLARSVGQSTRVLKGEMRELRADGAGEAAAPPGDSAAEEPVAGDRSARRPTAAG